MKRDIVFSFLWLVLAVLAIGLVWMERKNEVRDCHQHYADYSTATHTQWKIQKELVVWCLEDQGWTHRAAVDKALNGS